MTDIPSVSARTLAIIDEVIGLRLRRHYRAHSDQSVYQDLLKIAVAAQQWRVTHADGSGVALSTSEGGSSEVLTAAEAAKAAGVTPNGMRWLIRHGRIDAERRDGRWLVNADSLAAYLVRRAQNGGGKCRSTTTPS